MQLQGPVVKVKRRIYDPASSELLTKQQTYGNVRIWGLWGRRKVRNEYVEVRPMILG